MFVRDGALAKSRLALLLVYHFTKSHELGEADIYWDKPGLASLHYRLLETRILVNFLFNFLFHVT